jgi:hypothetical protein
VKAPAQLIELNINNNGQHLPKVNDDPNRPVPLGSTPPESVFIKLAPSRERYSLKYDGEL